MIPDFDAIAQDQLEAAITRGRQDLSQAPGWFSSALHQLLGPMMPGDLWMVGAVQANGKTAFMLSEVEYLSKAGIPTLYFPLEVDPADVLRRRAALLMDLDPVLVARNRWDVLGDIAHKNHESMMDALAADPYVRFPPDRCPSLASLTQWVQHAIDDFGVRLVIVDHFHRLDFGPAGAQYRLQVADMARRLKDLTVRHGIVCLSSAQLNESDADHFDRFKPPLMRRLRESAALRDEADGIVMLSRKLRPDLTKSDFEAVRSGFKSDRDIAVPNVMVATCRKHRLADANAGDRSVDLYVRHGRVEDLAPHETPYGRR